MRVLLASLLAIAPWLFFSSPATAQATGDASSYRVGPGDRLQLRVAQLPELNLDTVVDDDGFIQLPLIGAIAIRGATLDEIQARIREDLLAQGLRQPSVVLRITDFRSQPISVLGAVEQPGTVSLRGPLPLFDVVLEAGGLAAGHGPSIYIRRTADNGLSDQLEVSIAALLDQGDPLANIPIFPGDRINVPVARELTYFFIGEVANAGQQTFSMTQGVTLLEAIARAGGLSETAGRKIRIKRLVADGAREEIVVDYRRILDGKDPDVTLQDGDIIVVKGSFF